MSTEIITRISVKIVNKSNLKETVVMDWKPVLPMIFDGSKLEIVTTVDKQPIPPELEK